MKITKEGSILFINGKYFICDWHMTSTEPGESAIDSHTITHILDYLKEREATLKRGYFDSRPLTFKEKIISWLMR